MKYAVIGIGVLLGILGLTWVFTGNDFFLYKVFAPREEAVRRETFEQSKAYNEGMAQEIRSAQLDYARAKTLQEKQAIASYILHQEAGYESAKLPADLQDFMSSMRDVVTQ
jgi:hypothetical protein